MNAQAEINWIAQELEKRNNPSLILLFKKLLAGNQTQEGGDRATIEQYNAQIQAASKRAHAGEFTSQEDLDREMEQW